MSYVFVRAAVKLTACAAALSAATGAAADAQGAGPVVSDSASGAVAAIASVPLGGYDFAAQVHQGSVTFKVPKTTCGTEPMVGFALGLGDDDDDQPISLGTVFVECDEQGARHYKLSAKAHGVQGSGDEYNVHAGDSVTVSYRVTGSTLTVTTTDNTTTATVVASGSSTAADTHLTFGAFPLFQSGDDLETPDFGKATFSKVTVNGKRPKNGERIVYRWDIEVGPYDKGSFTLKYAG